MYRAQPCPTLGSINRVSSSTIRCMSTWGFAHCGTALPLHFHVQNILTAIYTPTCGCYFYTPSPIHTSTFSSFLSIYLLPTSSPLCKCSRKLRQAPCFLCKLQNCFQSAWPGAAATPAFLKHREPRNGSQPVCNCNDQ